MVGCQRLVERGQSSPLRASQSDEVSVSNLLVTLERLEINLSVGQVVGPELDRRRSVQLFKYLPTSLSFAALGAKRVSNQGTFGDGTFLTPHHHFMMRLAYG